MHYVHFSNNIISTIQFGQPSKQLSASQSSYGQTYDSPLIRSSSTSFAQHTLLNLVYMDVAASIPSAVPIVCSSKCRRRCANEATLQRRTACATEAASTQRLGRIRQFISAITLRAYAKTGKRCTANVKVNVSGVRLWVFGGGAFVCTTIGSQKHAHTCRLYSCVCLFHFVDNRQTV